MCIRDRGDILFESVVDEECAGASGTLASRMMGHNADYGIILEPTGLAICPACVGSLLFRLTVKDVYKRQVWKHSPARCAGRMSLLKARAADTATIAQTVYPVSMWITNRETGLRCAMG